MILNFIQADLEQYIKQKLKFAMIDILNQHTENVRKETLMRLPVPLVLGLVASPIPMSRINFSELYLKKGGETFSQMLIRLIKESGKGNSAIYNRANIDRRLFSKIVNNENYRPSKQTAVAFAIALKLNHEKTQKLLSTAGFILSNSSMFDMIVSYFIEHEIFDIDLINQQLYEYKQALLGC